MVGLTKQSYQSLDKNLNALIQVLDKSTKESIKIYDYVNEEELIAGQKFLLKFGDKLLMNINEGEESLRNLKWKALRKLMERGEFSLNFIGFDLNASNMNQVLFNKKKALALKFQ